MIAFATIWFLSVLIWKLINNYQKWVKNKSVDHIGEWWLWAGLNVPPLIVFASQLDLQVFWTFVLSASMMGIVSLSLFNPAYNLLRRRYLIKKGYEVHPKYLTWFHISKPHKLDKSLLDGIWRALPKWVYVLFMTVVPILLVVMYILSTSP